MGRPALAAVILFLTFALSALAQTPTPSHVLIPLIATDRHKEPIQDLTAASMVVSDSKVRVSDVQLLRGSELPLEIGILLDTSTSERTSNIKAIADNARDFANTVLNRPDDRVFFMTFDIDAGATEWMTKQELSDVALNLKFGGGTALYDAIDAASRIRLGPQNWNHPARRFLILVSDGEDNLSHVTLDEAASEALKSGAMIFALGTDNTNRMGGMGERKLEHLIKLTGGEFFPTFGSKEIPKDFASIKEIVDSLYYVSYAPLNPINGIHQIEIRIASKEKIELSYPKSYFWTH